MKHERAVVRFLSTWREKGVLTALALTLVTAFSLLMASTRADGRSAGDLVISAGSLNFGQVWCQRDFSWTVPIENRSDHTIHVASLQASCGCTSVEPSSFTLPPGAEQDLTFTLDLLPNNRKGGSGEKIVRRQFLGGRQRQTDQAW